MKQKIKEKSSKPSKRRKSNYTIAIHKVRKEFSAHLSKELRAKIGRRSLELRKGDLVKVMRGDKKYVGKQAKVVEVRRTKRQVFLENIVRKKANGTEVLVPFRPSNLMIIAIDEKDNRRFKARKKK
ncbi:MAG: 50S ribosomal protein L24 [Candidatus Diapherotrites archaeon]